MYEMFAGVSLESRRRLFREGGTRRAPVAVEVQEMVECVLRATEGTDTAEEHAGSCMLATREWAVLHMECRLTVSVLSSLEIGLFCTVRWPPHAVEVGVVKL